MTRLLLSTIQVMALCASLPIISASRGDLVAFGNGANAFSIDFVTIGNPGNAADTTGAPNPSGSVAYSYQIGKYEISRDMVTKASTEGGLGITMSDMTLFGGNGLNQPATGVGWSAAAKFTNWLNTSSGFQAAYKFNGGNFELWQLGDAGYDAANPYRNSLTRYVLPSIDEFYKAAYYDPAKPGGAGYWDFATGSNTAPTAVAAGTLQGTVVYNQSSANGPAVIDQAGGLSPFGVMGLSGNVLEMQETAFDGVNDTPGESRHVGRGVWNYFDHNNLKSTNSGAENFTSMNANVGFRVASLSSNAAVPEPATGVALGCVFTLLVLVRRRNRNSAEVSGSAPMTHAPPALTGNPAPE